MKKVFIYFVEDTETSFVLNDLKQVSSQYERVILLSTETVDNAKDLPKNTEVYDNFIDWKNLNLKKIFLANFIAILVIYFRESLACQRLLPIKKSIALLCSNFYKAAECQKVLNSISGLDYKEAPFYAFWFYDCVYLARLKQLGIAKHTYIRAHGGDLFEERSSLSGNVLFRNYQLKYTSRLFSVSETGTNYLQKKYPLYKNTIETLYLGSHYHNTINALSTTEFVIVSCAKVRDIKRIHLIAEALMLLDFNCIWYHLGDENLNAFNDDGIPLYIKAKEALKARKNIVFKTMGAMSNESVFEFYKNTPINAFISVSASEGIPVSMMEAISFGIPVISTDVGGCHEIVKPQTGILIPADATVKQIAHSITTFCQSEMNTSEFRIQTRRFWEENFNADKNYSQLFDTLSSIKSYS